MKNLLLMLTIMLLAAGCSSPVRSPSPAREQTAHADAVWQIEISRRGDLKFAGLLGTRLDGEGLYYVLLDSSGVTLLEARLDADGKQQSIRKLAIFREHRLPGFLATALHRIFLLEPAGAGCGRNFLPRLCQKQTAGQQMVKTARLGPVGLWSVEYSPAIIPGEWTGITFDNPWLGVTLALTENPAAIQR
jgi:hypothetical protein